MNNKIRNRLIGSITILLLIIIFFPYMVKDKTQQPETTITIIDSDILHQDIMVDDADEPVDIVVEYDNTVPTNENIPESQQAIPETAPNGVADNNNAKIETDKVYNIQLAALKNQQKIEELVALLRLNNYEVYTDPAAPQNGQLIRLFVGPYSSKEQAELIILDLKNLTKLNGFITSQ